MGWLCGVLEGQLSKNMTIFWGDIFKIIFLGALVYDVFRDGTYLTPTYYHCDTDGYSQHNAWHCLHTLVCILTILSGPSGAMSLQDGVAQFPLGSCKAMYVHRQCYAYS